MDNWNPIATAPKDGSIVLLRDADHVCDCAMYWNEKTGRWEGMAYSMMGAVKTHWDESFLPIHEWKHIK